jgi:hypothetical protein
LDVPWIGDEHRFWLVTAPSCWRVRRVGALQHRNQGSIGMSDPTTRFTTISDFPGPTAAAA